MGCWSYGRLSKICEQYLIFDKTRESIHGLVMHFDSDFRILRIRYRWKLVNFEEKEI